jgi:phosphatidylserine/phosphatidylglycerophosphate/cardiolipin synthase-like enzyme
VEPDAERVQLVATGPRSRLVPIRSSEDVLLELIGQARHRLLIISFATFRVPAVREALVAAMDRGVAVTMLMEDAELGELCSGSAYADLAPRVRMLAWPADQRVAAGPTRPKMHAKAAAVDGERAFITSANLTGAGLEHNLELGTQVTSGDLPAVLERHVGELLRAGVMVVVT